MVKDGMNAFDRLCAHQVGPLVLSVERGESLPVFRRLFGHIECQEVDMLDVEPNRMRQFVDLIQAVSQRKRASYPNGVFLASSATAMSSASCGGSTLTASSTESSYDPRLLLGSVVGCNDPAEPAQVKLLI